MTDAKRMDVHEALDEVRAQKEVLEEEIRTKTDVCNNLIKSQNELMAKFQETKLQSEKQAQELTAKSEELSTLTLLHQDLKASFQEKESSVKKLTCATEKLRYEYAEKLQKLEGESKELVLALEEARTSCLSLKSDVDASHAEVEDLKRIISLKDKKLVAISDKAQKSKDLTQRDAVIAELEEKHRDVEDQLKWRNEQFQHLEEAHKRLQDNFKSCKAEWEKEKSFLIKEMGSLQTSLDSQTRLSENLQTQLRICNQALAHEESTRKVLEVEVSEYKRRFDSISSECDEAKGTIEKLTHKRDEEVAELRDTLAEKDSVYKEMGYKMLHLEQENKDLAASLKEFREFQIGSCGNTGSLKKLQKKLNGLEQVHKKCGQNLKEKEAEWKFELEKIRKEMDEYLTKLKVESEQVEKLQEELESFHLAAEVHNEEMVSVVLVLESQFSEAYSKLELKNKENEEMVEHLTEQLEMKNNALCEVNATLSKKCEQVATNGSEALSEKQTSLEEGNWVLENSRIQDDTNVSEASQKFVELEKKKLLAESQNAQLETENQSLLHRMNEQSQKIAELKKQVVLLETSVTETVEVQKQEKEKYLKVIKDKESSIEKLLEAIEERNQKMEELVEESKALKNEKMSALKTCEETRIERDVMHRGLQKLEFEVSDLGEKLKLKDESLVQSTQRAKELEILMQSSISETENLRKQSDDEKMRLEKGKLISESHNIQLETENQSLVGRVNEQNEKIVELQEQLVLLETLVTETIKAQKQEKEKLLEVTEERNWKMEELVGDLKALENEKMNALMASEEKEIEIHCMQQALQKLELEVSSLCEKLKVKDESLEQSIQQAKEVEASLQINKLETENLKKQSEDEKMRLENLVKESEFQVLNYKLEMEKLKEQSEDEKVEYEVQLVNYKLEMEKLKEQSEKEKMRLEVENRGLSEDIKKLLSDKEDWVTEMEMASKQFDEYSKEVELTGMLENLLNKCDVNLPFFPLHKGKSEIADARLPLVNLNK